MWYGSLKMPRMLRVMDLGRLDYQAALAVQERVLETKTREPVDDCLILVEHPHVITTGRRGSGRPHPRPRRRPGPRHQPRRRRNLPRPRATGGVSYHRSPVEAAPGRPPLPEQTRAGHHRRPGILRPGGRTPAALHRRLGRRPEDMRHRRRRQARRHVSRRGPQRGARHELLPQDRSLRPRLGPDHLNGAGDREVDRNGGGKVLLVRGFCGTFEYDGLVRGGDAAMPAADTAGAQQISGYF